MIGVERVDFVSVPSRDPAQARRFYGELLGLRESTTPEDVFPEFETANVTIGIYQPEMIGMRFLPNPGIALRVPDVDEARRALEQAGGWVGVRACIEHECASMHALTPLSAAHRRYAPPRPHGMSHADSRELVEN